MSATEDPRIVSTSGMPGDRGDDGAPLAPAADPPYDPLRLCIFTTVALLGWLAGPYALLVFAVAGFTGYLRARRAGLRMSRCFLRDTRLVLLYLGALALLAAWGVVRTLG